ncbi:hypothetical protein Sjap_024376 [Stephania japonica]|uniref:Uncharacterized protein n=1 Tax=Stephania japonica TaxID=461633 RepID=A0AAP0HLF4_9MAGN
MHRSRLLELVQSLPRLPSCIGRKELVLQFSLEHLPIYNFRSPCSRIIIYSGSPPKLRITLKVHRGQDDLLTLLRANSSKVLLHVLNEILKLLYTPLAREFLWLRHLCSGLLSYNTLRGSAHSSLE